MPTSRKQALHQGYTLTEVIIVLSILSILAAIAVPRFANSDSTLIAQAHSLSRDLRHVQTIAMNQGRTLTFEVQSATSYRVIFGGSTITDPTTMQPYSVTLDNDVRLSGKDAAFDSMGRPVTSGSLIAAKQLFTLSGNSRTVSVTLSPVTGFVAISP